MARRVEHQHKRRHLDPHRVFTEIRGKIGEQLQDPALQVRRLSNEELAIGTFVPSWIVNDCRISDYPFIGARYVSRVTGEVFIVEGSHPEQPLLICREVGFLRSFFDNGVRRVAISVEGWLENVMHVYSTNQIHLGMQGGELAELNGELTVRRSYPGLKFRAYLRYLSDHHRLWRLARTLCARLQSLVRRRAVKAKVPSAEQSAGDASPTH
ncbi:hypothetical protein [Cupriavidus pampae]|uniref:Uncharacterized protein n=1 Tax=Cupriavidus pampae TaxID=659251 RepID=A0ABN7ZEB6_9BURK|nr:hypothetical protein [Cupriavidus pampae]CAG9183678.1 hypothetical protein LMG32289_05388 [Cupriavidus pampae]